MIMMKGYEQKKYPVATSATCSGWNWNLMRRLSVNIAACIQKVCNGRRFVTESVRLVSWRWRFTSSATDW